MAGLFTHFLARSHLLLEPVQGSGLFFALSGDPSPFVELSVHQLFFIKSVSFGRDMLVMESDLAFMIVFEDLLPKLLLLFPQSQHLLHHQGALLGLCICVLVFLQLLELSLGGLNFLLDAHMLRILRDGGRLLVEQIVRVLALVSHFVVDVLPEVLIPNVAVLELLFVKILGFLMDQGSLMCPVV
jgi:hypothetical protein